MFPVVWYSFTWLQCFWAPFQYDCHFLHHSTFLSRPKQSLQLSILRFCGFSDLFALHASVISVSVWTGLWAYPGSPELSASHGIGHLAFLESKHSLMLLIWKDKAGHGGLLELSPIIPLWIRLCSLFQSALSALFTFLRLPIFMFEMFRSVAVLVLSFCL